MVEFEDERVRFTAIDARMALQILLDKESIAFPVEFCMIVASDVVFWFVAQIMLFAERSLTRIAVRIPDSPSLISPSEFIG